jgi:hypothetical protein
MQIRGDIGRGKINQLECSFTDSKSRTSYRETSGSPVQGSRHDRVAFWMATSVAQLRNSGGCNAR